MELIDKAAVVAEIDKLINSLRKSCNSNPLGSMQECLTAAEIEALSAAKDAIKDIKVKEEDLEEEFNNYIESVEGVPRMWHSDEQIVWAKSIAKHFFELGLNTRKEN